MPANAFECAEGITASEQQHCKGQNDDNDLMDVGTFHFIEDQPSIAVNSFPKTEPAVLVWEELNQEHRDGAAPLLARLAVLVQRAGPDHRDRARVAGG